MNNICPKCGGELVLSMLVRYDNVPIWDGCPETEMGDEYDAEITSVRPVCVRHAQAGVWVIAGNLFPKRCWKPISASFARWFTKNRKPQKPPNCKKPTEREWIEFANTKCD